MRFLVLSAIRLYQRHISPYKGFCCAYGLHTGRGSCSALGFRAVRRFGAINGLKVLRNRLLLCGVAHRRYGPSRARPHRSQRGDCDLSCDLPVDGGCDMPDLKSCRVSDVLGCADGCSCDWPSRDKKGREKDIYIPPKVIR